MNELIYLQSAISIGTDCFERICGCWPNFNVVSSVVRLFVDFIGSIGTLSSFLSLKYSLVDVSVNLKKLLHLNTRDLQTLLFKLHLIDRFLYTCVHFTHKYKRIHDDSTISNS